MGVIGIRVGDLEIVQDYLKEYLFWCGMEWKWTCNVCDKDVLPPVMITN